MPTNSPTLEFKSGSFSVPILILFTDDLKAIGQQLQEKVDLAPEFFKNSPLIFDVQELNKLSRAIDIPALVDIIRQSGLLPTGIRGGTAQQNKEALALLIPVYSAHSSTPTSADTQAQKQKIIESESSVNASATIITRPVRSGQRLYALGDLIVLAQVSAGAEIMAEGNIHVYNTLRGRALAGVQGNVDARIFCSDLQAELISIAGNYKISEDMRDVVSKKSVQVYLQGHTLIIKDIV
ncbi:MAG: septum site-determining protein MinC [Methylococcales bacterium]